MTEKLYCLYKHTSPSGKSYIGQTSDYQSRNIRHKHGGCRAFINAIQKYGWDNFTHEILLNGLTLDEANVLEEQLIEKHNTRVPNGYNLLPGGNNHTHHDTTKQILRELNTGKVLSAKTRQRMSEARIGKKHSKKTIEKLKHRERSETHRQNLLKASTKRRGQPLPEETKQKISEANSGKVPWNKGKRLSEEHKQKLRKPKRKQR